MENNPVIKSAIDSKIMLSVYLHTAPIVKSIIRFTPEKEREFIEDFDRGEAFVKVLLDEKGPLRIVQVIEAMRYCDFLKVSGMPYDGVGEDQWVLSGINLGAPVLC